MTSVDELFKDSGLSSKRKLDPVRDPNEIYKSAKLGRNGHSRHARVEEGAENIDGQEADQEAAPAPPPAEGDGEGEDGDYGPTAPPEGDGDQGDDDEGRFFGGGITRQEAEVLDYVEGADADAAGAVADDKIDRAWLRRTALAFERRISRNAELRARHPDEPSRFIESEADLDGSVRALSILGEHPELYSEFARLGCAASLASLLAHDNTDVALAAVQILAELTGEDVDASEADWAALVDALLEADLVSLLVSNLGRLDEDGEDEADREGVYHILEVVENLCSRASTAETVGADDALLRWLLDRARKPEKSSSTSSSSSAAAATVFAQNKQYAAEVLAILAQTSAKNRERLAASDLDFVEQLLQLLAPYRGRDPGKGDEEEYMENLFEALTCIVDCAEGKRKFVEAEGAALCLVLMQSRKRTRVPSLRLLDHAAGQSREQGVCERIVEYGGLKTLFTMFMSSSSSSGGNTKKGSDEPRVLEHLIAIFAWMLRLLPHDSAERIRTLAKFVEKDYEKTTRLVRLRGEYAARVRVVDRQIEQEGRGMDSEEKAEAADDWFSRRLDAGLFCLQTIDVTLAWLVAEDSGAGKKIRELLADKGETFTVIKASLQEQAEGVDASTEDGQEVKDMLATLAEFLV